MLRSGIVIAAGAWFIACGAHCYALDVTLRLEVAQTRIARNDCQLVRVVATNNAPDPIEINPPFDAGFGPGLEVQTGMHKFIPISGLGQGYGMRGKGAGTIVSGNSQLAVFLVLAQLRTERNESIPAFEVSGNYKIRARIRVNKQIIYSNTETFDVADDMEIERWEAHWKDPDSLDLMMQFPLPAKPGKRPAILASLPEDSLTRRMGFVGLVALAYAEDPKNGKKAWQRERAQAGPLMADFLSDRLAHRFYNQEQFALAIEEMQHVEIPVVDSVGFIEDAQRRLDYEQSKGRK